MKVLLTGGSGFVAAHCLDQLLEHGHDVVTTVRSSEKGKKIMENYPGVREGRLSYVIVEDIAQEGSFDQAVISDPPFDAVIHTASPFHMNVANPQKDMLDPAIIGTTGILKAIKANAPSVTRVVVTSSFAAVVDFKNPPKIYSEDNWNPITKEEALADPTLSYRGSKKLAEKAVYDFVKDEKPNFQVCTICPPLIFGPVVRYLSSLDAINESNVRIRDMVQGKMKEKLWRSGLIFLWVDVRDVALAHVKAIEVSEAGGKRFLVIAGHMCNYDIAEAIRNNFPELKSQLPPEDSERDLAQDLPGFDNSRSLNILGLTYRSLSDSVRETAASILAVQVRGA